MKQVLIVGKDSYIGEHLKAWLDIFPKEYKIDIISPLDHKWNKADFKQYDTVVNVAGIAHIKNITDDMKDLFYSVNRDLAYEIASHAKNNGVHHFIHFSSMNVYGDYCDNLKERGKAHPTSFYGDSKLQGDKGIRGLEDKFFKAAYIRPPFVYGKGCKGNYNTISKIAKLTPVFPTYKNKKSMIYIDNLCEFVRLVIDNETRGILTPQNKELVSTSDLVREIALSNSKKIHFTSLFNWMIKPASLVSNYVKKAFADDCYDLRLSDYFDFEYSIVGFEESVRRTEE